jgi:hypothetical protein
MDGREAVSSATRTVFMPSSLHASAETKDKMKGRLLLDVIVRQSATVTILKPFAHEDKALLVGRSTTSGDR